MAEIDTLFLTKTVKTQPFGAAHIYITHVREFPPPPEGAVGIKLRLKSDTESTLNRAASTVTLG